MAWADREAKVLEAILAVEEADRDRLMTDELASTTGLDEADARRALLALIESGHVSVTQKLGGNHGPAIMIMPRLREKGRRAVGQWPKDGYDALVAILEDRIRTTSDGDEKTRLSRFLEAVRGMSRDVLTDVIAAAIKSAGGLP
jgi:hypothetical protein